MLRRFMLKTHITVIGLTGIENDGQGTLPGGVRTTLWLLGAHFFHFFNRYNI